MGYLLEPLAEETTLPPLRSLALTHCWNIELNWFLDVYTRISSQHANRSSDGRAELSPQSDRHWLSMGASLGRDARARLCLYEHG